MGGEVEGDVALEEALEEGGQKPAALLRNEPVLLQLDIAPVLQGLKRRRIGGGAADAELLHLLDQARLGVTRRRLGEMLLGDDLLLRRRIALAKPRQAAGFLVVAVVTAFLVKGEEAGEEDD